MKIRALLSLAIAFVSTGCSSISTTADWNPTFDFSQLSTYAWISSEGEIDAITSSRVRAAVNQAMAERGYTESDANPGLAVGYQVTTDQRSSFTTVSTGWSSGYRWGSPSWGMGTSTTRETVFTDGTLILAIFDTEARTMVWTASATAELNQARDAQERQQLIETAVNRMMQDFPPGN
jgi:hypothetical protein